MAEIPQFRCPEYEICQDERVETGDGGALCGGEDSQPHSPMMMTMVINAGLHSHDWMHLPISQVTTGSI